MHLMRESWTDARLDDFRAEVDRRFGKVEGEIRELRGEVKELRSEMKAGFESVHRTMIQGVVALSASFIAGFAAVVTQL
jgi:hypothetical protein